MQKGQILITFKNCILIYFKSFDWQEGSDRFNHLKTLFIMYVAFNNKLCIKLKHHIQSVIKSQLDYFVYKQGKQ